MDKQDWFREWFQDDYLEVYQHRNRDDAVALLDFAIPYLSLRKDSRILDLACGAGRHLELIRQRYPRSYGIDLSSVLLDKAICDLPSLAGHLVHGDMLRLPFCRPSFDAIFNLFTSFGYFATDAQHQKALQFVAAVLNKGGRLFVDFLNRDRIVSDLAPLSRRELRNGLTIEERRSITEAPERVEKRIVIRYPDGRIKNFVESVRMFTENDWRKMLSRSGLTLKFVIGDLQGGPLTKQSERMFIVAEK